MEGETLRLGDGQNFVELRVLERGSTPDPSEGDVRLDVSAGMGGFRGRYDQVWIARDAWRAFVDSMRPVERERLGRASLLSMSPGEFELHLEITRRGGKVTAFGHLARYHFPSGAAPRSRIEYRCEVDPSSLRELLDAFASMTPATP